MTSPTELLCRLSLSLLAALFAVTAAAQSAPMPATTQLAVGDRWEWRQVDNRTKLQEPAFFWAVVDEKGDRRIAYSDGRVRPLEHPYVGDASSKPWRVWPLEVGKTWSIDVDFRAADGTPGNLRQDARVLAYEEVVVPAGKFMAFKIEKDGLVRLQSGFAGPIVDTFWYAPAVRADVKHVRKVGRSDFTRELVSYPAARQ